MPITHYIEWTVERGEQDPFDVCVDYEISGGCPAQLYGLPENCYPAEAPDLELKSIWLKANENDANAPEFKLSEDEYEALESYILENPPEPDYD